MTNAWTERSKAYFKNYFQSEKGKEAQRRAKRNYFSNPENVKKDRERQAAYRQRKVEEQKQWMLKVERGITIYKIKTANAEQMTNVRLHLSERARKLYGLNKKSGKLLESTAVVFAGL